MPENSLGPESGPPAARSNSDLGISANAVETALTQRPAEVGGRGGLDPTRYGDWEKAGRCIDF